MVDKAAARISAQLAKGGFDDAMIAALTGERCWPPTRPR